MTRTPLESLTDEELVEVFVKRSHRDDRPFHELFRRYKDVVWRICYGVVHNTHDAEDLAQEIFINIHANLKNFEGRSSLKTWIYRIAINTSRNELRKRSRRPQVSSTTIEDVAEHLESEETVEEFWTKKVQSESLRFTLKQLPPQQLNIIRLRDFEQRSYKEISEILNISESATKMRIQRARLALQQILQTLEDTQTSL